MKRESWHRSSAEFPPRGGRSDNAREFARDQLGERFQLGGAGYPADGSKPINMWTEKGFEGYQVYPTTRTTAVPGDRRPVRQPVRIKPL